MVGSLSILYVGSDRERADSVAATLEREWSEFSASSVTTAEDALTHLDDGAVDCLVSEHELPDVDGLALLAETFDLYPAVPCFLFTAASSEELAREAYSAGITDYVHRAGAASVLILGHRIETAVAPHEAVNTPQQVEAAHRVLMQAVSDVVITIDETSTIRFVNQAVEEVFGYTPDELLGEPLTVLMPEPLRQQHLTALQRYLATGEKQLDWQTIELRGRDSAGNHIPLGISFGEFEDQGERFFIGVLRDITDRKQLEADLRQERDLNERLVETSPIGIAIVESPGMIVRANERAHQVLGLAELDDATLPVDVSMFDLTAPDGTPLPESERPLQRVQATNSPVYDQEYKVTRPDGESIWLTGNAAPLREEDGEVTAVILAFADSTAQKQYEQALTTLQRSTRRLLRADSSEDVCQLVVDAAGEMLDLESLGIYLFDSDVNELRPVATATDHRASSGDPPTVTAGDSIAWQVFVEGEPAVFDDVRTSNYVAEPGTAIRSQLAFPLGEHGVFLAGSPTVGAVDDVTIELADLVTATAEAALDRVSREATLRERDKELQQQNRQLSRVNQLNEIIRGIDQVLVEASTRDEIEYAVCERLLAAEQVAFAWIGEPDPITEVVAPRAWDGTDRGYLDSVSFAFADESGLEPAARTAYLQEMTLVSSVADELHTEPWRKAALSRNYQSVISVPLAYDDYFYGVLTVYADNPDAFDDLSQSVFSELSESIAKAINVVETTRMQFTESVIELDFRLHEADDVLCRLARHTACQLDLEGFIPQTDGTSRIFFTVHGMAADQFLIEADQSTAIDAISLVADRDAEALFVATVSRPTLVAVLVNHGAMVSQLTADSSEAQVIVELPSTANVRGFIDMVETKYPDADFVARREHDRPFQTRHTFHSDLEDRLTDRQLEVLRTAYLSGFFEAPRESTGEEVAAMLDISQSTFNEHLRAGERKFFQSLFGE